MHMYALAIYYHGYVSKVVISICTLGYITILKLNCTQCRMVKKWLTHISPGYIYEICICTTSHGKFQFASWVMGI